MNNFINKLPATYKSLKVQLKNAESEYRGLQADLGDDDYGYHDCDCEYCPVPEAPDLTAKERQQKEAELEKLDTTIDDYSSTIKSVEGYAKLVGVDLEKK